MSSQMDSISLYSELANNPTLENPLSYIGDSILGILTLGTPWAVPGKSGKGVGFAAALRAGWNIGEPAAVPFNNYFAKVGAVQNQFDVRMKEIQNNYEKAVKDCYK